MITEAALAVNNLRKPVANFFAKKPVSGTIAKPVSIGGNLTSNTTVPPTASVIGAAIAPKTSTIGGVISSPFSAIKTPSSTMLIVGGILLVAFGIFLLWKYK